MAPKSTRIIRHPLFFKGLDVTGTWHGLLSIGATELRIDIHIDRNEDSLTAKLDSPDQGGFGIPLSKVKFENSELSFEQDQINANYVGSLEGEKINGVFTQYGQSIDLTFSRDEAKKATIMRPQTPVEPFSYAVEEVNFTNTDVDITLAGTLTKPIGELKHPALILISGSGPQDRNEELFGHKPFLVIADYLSQNGFAVLRYDERGVGESTGSYKGTTSFDLAEDVLSAIDYLKTRDDIDHQRIGLIGHSEGGMIAPMVANQSQDVACIVMLAGPGLSGDQVLLTQQSAIAKENGADQETIQRYYELHKSLYSLAKNSPDSSLREDIENNLIKAYANEELDSMSIENIVDEWLNQLLDPWMNTFLKHDPALDLEKLECPVLALNGSLDLQVLPKENLDAIESALTKAGNTDFEIIELVGLNHLFQECESGSPLKYGQIEETFSPKALEVMKDWLTKRLHVK